MLTQQQHVFGTEDEARQHFEDLIRPFYFLVPEVWMTHDQGQRLRIDYVGIPRHTSPIELRTEIIGFEIKKSHLTPGSTFQPFIRALQQAIDYRHSRITDKRAKVYQGQRLGFVFVFPDYSELRQLEHLKSNADWIFGVIRLAGRYNVGVVRQQRTWSGERFVELEVAGTAVWRSNRGLVNGAGFGGARKRGSQ